MRAYILKILRYTLFGKAKLTALEAEKGLLADSHTAELGSLRQQIKAAEAENEVKRQSPHPDRGHANTTRRPQPRPLSSF